MTESLEFKVYMKGAISGIIGGIFFGVMMQLMGLMPMIAMLVGSDNVVIGWIVHLITSAIFGLAFGIGMLDLGSESSIQRNIIIAIILGIIFWVLGPLILMPLILDLVNGGPIMGYFAVGEADIQMSLLGHLMWSVISVMSFRYLK